MKLCHRNSNYKNSRYIALAAIFLAIALAGPASADQASTTPGTTMLLKMPEESLKMPDVVPSEVLEHLEQGSGNTNYKSTILYKSKNLTLAVAPIEFSADLSKWNYKVSWKLPDNEYGSIYINGKQLRPRVWSEYGVSTDFILKPRTYNSIVFYSLPDGQGKKLVNKKFRSLPAPASNDDKGSATFLKKISAKPGQTPGPSDAAMPGLNTMPTMPGALSTSAPGTLMPMGGKATSTNMNIPQGMPTAGTLTPPAVMPGMPNMVMPTPTPSTIMPPMQMP